ncbi:MAG: PqqD family protein [Actinomycetota bacterium]
MAPRRAPEATYEVVDDQAVIVDARRAELVTLNAVGTVVWEYLDGARDASSIAVEIDRSGRFEGVSVATLERDVSLFIEELSRSGLVEP